MRYAALLALSSLLLAGCASGDLHDDATVAPRAANDDCSAVAVEHRKEAAFAGIDDSALQQIYDSAYQNCEQWKSAHGWNQPQALGPQTPGT